MLPQRASAVELFDSRPLDLAAGRKWDSARCHEADLGDLKVVLVSYSETNPSEDFLDLLLGQSLSDLLDDYESFRRLGLCAEGNAGMTGQLRIALGYSFFNVL